MRKSYVLVLALVTFAPPLMPSATGVGGSTALAFASELAQCDSTSVPVVEVQGSDITSCEVSTSHVEVDGVTVPIPALNGGIEYSALWPQGSLTLSVKRSAEGLLIEERDLIPDEVLPLLPDNPDPVVIEGMGEKPYEIISEDTASSVPGACQDVHYLVDDFKEYDLFHWRYNRANISSRWKGPRYDLDDIRRANTNMTRGRNSCGFEEGAFFSRAQYDGTTTRSANISPGVCATDDGYSVVSWGNTGGSLALQCDWDNGGDLKHSDIEISNGDVTWFSTKPAYCQTAFDLESVMTHEWGHTFGLEDVNSNLHPNLTMSSTGKPCNRKGRTLGNGDWQGMDSMYGT